MRPYATAARGLTLVEVLVASTIFLVVTATILTALFFSQRSQRKHSQDEEAVRACLVVVEHLRQHLRVAVVESVSADSLSYRVGLFNPDGTPQLAPGGEVLWSAPYTVFLRDDRVLREHQGVERQLAVLGAGGEFKVEQTQLNLVGIEVSSTHGVGYRLATKMHLLNQF